LSTWSIESEIKSYKQQKYPRHRILNTPTRKLILKHGNRHYKGGIKFTNREVNTAHTEIYSAKAERNTAKAEANSQTGN